MGNGPKSDAFAKYFEHPQSVLLPTIIVYEVYKKILREQGQTLAERFLSHAYGFREREVPLDIPLAALAAKTSLDANLPMADAIIYATARSHSAELITSDAHFSGLPGVTIL
ncbi:MAG TPA: type II toxin-antitoxin system VapC family toxin [Candidatus Acidoferrum sp.]|nr:type II toxin-antitoxin system VapC family toxin [Candidatus Acidoferrum sp.]